MQDSELGVVPRGSGKATAFNCRKNEGSNSERWLRTGKLAGFDPAGRPHDLRSNDLSYSNMWVCIQLARRNTTSIVTAVG